MPPVPVLGARSVPDPLTLEGYFRFDLSEVSDCWTRATRDGRIDVTPEGATLWLQGARQTPPAIPEAGALRTLLEPGDLDAAVRALNLIDGREAPQPLSLARLLQEVVAEREDELGKAGVRVLLEEGPKTSQLLLRRSRIHALGHTLLDFCLWHLRLGAHVKLSLLEQTDERTVELQMQVEGEQAAFQESFHLSSMRRVVQDHQGHLEALCEGEQAMLAFTFPELVGRSLDAWLPGWTRFSARSQQMLRLLKGAAQSPPEQFILEGVLEEELERRLLPCLETPAARNTAKALESTAARQCFRNGPRAVKAIGQAARGKPKKEIAQPAYAAELIHLFGSAPEGLAALRMEDFGLPQRIALCESLVQVPVQAHAALMLLAQWPAEN